MLPFAMPCYRGIREIGEFLGTIVLIAPCPAFIFCISSWTIWPESNVLGIQIKSDISVVPLYWYIVAWEIWGNPIMGHNMRMNLCTVKRKRRLREYESVAKLFCMLRTIRMAERCHNSFYHIIELTNISSSLNGIWTHTTDTLQRK